MNRITWPRCSVTVVTGMFLLFAATLFAGRVSGADDFAQPGSVQSSSMQSGSPPPDSTRSDSAQSNSSQSWPLKFHPHLDLAATYDDNILISHTHQLRDFSFTVSPGLKLDYGDLTRNFLTLDYTAGIERFVKHTAQDAVNNYVSFRAGFNFTHLKLQLDNEFRDETSSNPQIGTRVHEEQDLTDASVEYLFSRLFSFGLLYHQEIHHFLTPGEIDNNEFEPGVALYYHTTPKVDLYSEFDYGWVDLQRGENQVFENITVGVRGKITPKISGRISVGYENRDYSGTTPTTDTTTASVSLHGDFTKHTSADFSILRQITPSATTLDTSYTATRVDLSVSHKFFMQKVVASVGGSYEHDDYKPDEDRMDDVWQANVGVRYIATKRLDAGVKYGYETDKSSIDTFSFNRNVVSIDALLHF